MIGEMWYKGAPAGGGSLGAGNNLLHRAGLLFTLLFNFLYKVVYLLFIHSVGIAEQVQYSQQTSWMAEDWLGSCRMDGGGAQTPCPFCMIWG